MPAQNVPSLPPMPQYPRLIDNVEVWNQQMADWQEMLEVWLGTYFYLFNERSGISSVEGRILEPHWNRAFFYDDFYGNALMSAWTTTITGSATATILSGSILSDVQLDPLGASIVLHTGNTQIRGNGFRSLTRAKLTNTGSNNFRFGAQDAAGNNEVQFDYSPAGVWVCRCSSGGTTTTATFNPAQTADTNYHFFGIYATSTRVQFFYDGIRVAEITTNIPTVALRLSFKATAGGGVDPLGGMQYWKNGLPFRGMKNGANDNGTMKFWRDGLHARSLFPSSGSSPVQVDYAKLWEARLDSNNAEIIEPELVYEMRN